MKKLDTINIELTGLPELATVQQLIEVLDAFHSIYNTAAQVYSGKDIPQTKEEIELGIAEYLGEEAVETQLMFSSLSMNSPLKMKLQKKRGQIRMALS